MADNAKYYVPAIAFRIPVDASFTINGLSGHTTTLSYNGIVFSPATGIDLSKMAPISMDLDTKSFKAKNLPAVAGSLIGNIYDAYPYGRVEVFIYELEVDMITHEVLSGSTIMKGLLYAASSRLDTRLLDVEIKEDKYYYDKTGGVACNEQCTAAYFGDKICGKGVTAEDISVLSISQSVLTLNSSPAASVFTYNNGYVEFEGLRIKIAFWESGAILSMSDIPPETWVGETVRLVAGCGKMISDCRRHNNESEFFGLGYSMVDYNALYETN
jgi:hypothetical protein